MKFFRLTLLLSSIVLITAQCSSCDNKNGSADDTATGTEATDQSGASTNDKDAATHSESDESASTGDDANATFSYVSGTENNTITWTAYKTTDKIAVSGVFDEFEIYDVQEGASSIADVFSNARFSINTSSINSGNAERDEKLRTYFFAYIKPSDKITGGVKSIGPNNDAVITINMNNVSKDIPASYTINGDEITLVTEIEFATFEELKAAEALNAECGELHTGPDGILMLWPTVRVEIKSKLNRAYI